MDLKTIFMTFFIITTLVSFAYPSLGQEDVDDEPLVKSGPEMDAVEAISPASQDYNMYMLENLQPKFTTHLENCMDKMRCNEDVFEEILTKKPVSRECCMKVLDRCFAEVDNLSSSHDD
ncbi:hypothetical protein N665_1512s0010 [Sinapis alba]|nr:hypothetical protein N665_1512s0010 [Sinapis alba]